MAKLAFDESSSSKETSRGYAWWFSGDTFEQAAAADRKPRRRDLLTNLVSHPGRLTILYLVTLIVIATFLLQSPLSTQSGLSTSGIVAFFTAVSALSTCGIQVVNTATHWSTFGQGVILLSVQMGGLGVMTFASIVGLAANRHLKASQRLLTANELGTNKLSEIKGVLRVVLGTTFIIEAITFIALFPGLWRINKGDLMHTSWQALFFAVASYNNAGFTPDIAGLHVDSWAVGLPILFSAFCGTLGFPVILNLVRSAKQHRPPRRWSLHTKITLATTFSLLALSLIWFLAVEWNNPQLFHNADASSRLRIALTAAVMPRTSGFDPSVIPFVSEPTKVFMSAIMFIGGGSASTAGGIRVTTFAVVLLVCRSAFTGKQDVNVFHKRIAAQTRMTAVSVAAACLALVYVISLSIMLVTGATFSAALFDTCSAFGLGGYSVGVAQAGNPAALTLLAAAMIIGRLGPMTIAYAISRPQHSEAVRYPVEPVVVG